MHGDDTQRIALELFATEGPISGRLITEDRQVSFGGWFELTAALEAARNRGDGDDEET